jgi:hypothetical protein
MPAVLLMPALATGDDLATGIYSELTISGHIDDRRVVEASGLARSHLVRDRLWTINDGGSEPRLFAIGANGKKHGTVILRDGSNVDWEDLASFEHDGKAWLLIADIGDNEGKRRFCTLYIVEEPALARGQSVRAARKIHFAYPDGPLDAESVAVDVDNGEVLILVKRTVPARLYRLALFADAEDGRQIADLLGDVASIPQPDQATLDNALIEQSWHWQPTAMDISRDGRTAGILTYAGLYLFERQGGSTWFEALQNLPQSLSLGDVLLAESFAFGDDDELFVTVEGHSPALYRRSRSH